MENNVECEVMNMDSMQSLPAPQILYDDSGQPVEAVFAYGKFESFIR